MMTLREYLEALADSGRAYVVKELDGYRWPPDELMEWLEWQAPAWPCVPPAIGEHSHNVREDPLLHLGSY